MKVIAYIRTSTKRQNLGLEAQREIIDRAAAYCGAEVLGYYTEQEHGTDDTRAEFAAALQSCKDNAALLCVAKVDRLSRNEKFSFAVRDELARLGLNIFEAESGRVLSPLEFGFKVVFAADELRRNRARTSEALQAKKAQGFKLGRPNATFTDEQREHSKAARRDIAKANPANRRAFALISTAQGLTLQAAADLLNVNGFQTPNGCNWSPTQVARLKALFA